MQIKEFKAIVKMFSDPDTELLFEKSRIVMQVNGDLIEADISAEAGDVFITENDKKETATRWIVKRLARLNLLASRLKDTIDSTEFFISPSVSYLPTLEADPNEVLVKSNDALKFSIDILGENSPLETNVIYITSDAGEGKTSLINELARSQAEAYLSSDADWLLVPIPLGGRHFMRFDDITIGALQNRYRFPFLYYNSFLALVKMGVIVPAFDGFEEMFVENSSGEALSAMGILLDSLDSQGGMVIAARKAYFEFENIKSQERLFDTVRTNDVSFVKLEINRWNKDHFLKYCETRGITSPEKIYEKTSERLGEGHALLTRAVLVKRLIDILEKTDTIDKFLEDLSGANYFSIFVEKIIEREANEKWIDRSGENEVGSPLLSLDEHIELLSSIAISMWESKTDYLKRDSLDFTAEYYCDLSQKNSFQANQIRERIRGHALLIPSLNADQAVEFDHDEFRYFFLGKGCVNLITKLDDRAKSDIYAIFRRGLLPKQAQDSFISTLRSDSNFDSLEVAKFFMTVSGMDVQASYTHENCSAIIIDILSGLNIEEFIIENMTFGLNALLDKKLENIIFDGCYFSTTSLELSEFENCKFVDCNLVQLQIHKSTLFKSSVMEESTVDSIKICEGDNETEYWEPTKIFKELSARGLKASNAELNENDKYREDDTNLRDFKKIIRYFMRSTHISESVIKIKLGNNFSTFKDDTLPLILEKEIFLEIENMGRSIQRRFRLNISLEKIHESIKGSNGSFDVFLTNISKS